MLEPSYYELHLFIFFLNTKTNENQAIETPVELVRTSGGGAVDIGHVCGGVSVQNNVFILIRTSFTATISRLLHCIDAEHDLAKPIKQLTVLPVRDSVPPAFPCDWLALRCGRSHQAFQYLIVC